MFEGKLKIELTDVKTGKKKTHEQHNLVTDNVQILLNSLPANALLPLCEKGMGGLMLFNDEITGNTGTSFIGRPKNAQLIGYADRGVDVSTAYKGSLNTAECVATENSFTNVWDFSTSQLNGTIGAIALTPLKETGSTNPSYSLDPSSGNCFDNRKRTVKNFYYKITYGANASTASCRVPGGYCQPIYYDPTTNFLYFVEYLETPKVVIFGRFRYTMQYGVNEEAYSTEGAEILFTSFDDDTYPTIARTYNCEDAFGVSATTEELDLGNLICLNWYGDKQGYVYGIQTAEKTIKWVKLKVYDGSFDLIEAKYATFEDYSFATSPGSYTSASGSGFGATGSFAGLIDDNKFAVLNATKTAVYIIEKSVSGLNIIQSISGEFTGNSSLKIFPDGIASIDGYCIYSGGISKTIGAIGYTDGRPRYQFNTGPTFYPYNCHFSLIQTAYSSYEAYTDIPSCLLSTICNLSQPVQKTSAQTMKITYTITSYRPIYISTQPHDSSGASGSQVTLTVAAADGSGSYSYQWQVSSDNITWTNSTEATANTNSLELTLSSSNTNKYYRCVVTDSLGNSVTSLSAYVTLTT